jgi:PAS domain S-box-containing protein
VTEKITKKESQKKARAQHIHTGETSPASEVLFSTIFNSSPMPMAITRVKDERIIDVNGAWEKTTGFNKAETIGHTTLELNCWATLDEREKLFNAMQGSGRLRDFEHRLRKKSGEISYMLMSAELVRYEGEQYIITMGTDITERKQMEASLRQSEELLRVTLSNILDPVFITDSHNKFTFICPNIPSILGYSREEILAMDNISKLVGENLFNPEDLEQHGEIINIEREIIDASGRQRTFLINIKLVSIGEGSLLYTMHEITERKQAEALLKQREKEYRTLVENIPDLLARFDAECRQIYLSPSISKACGIPEEALLGKTHLDPALPGDPLQKEAMHQAINRVLQLGEPFICEQKWLNSKGETYVEIRMVPEYDEAGKITSVLAIARDITKRKTAEEALRSRERQFTTVFHSNPAAITITSVKDNRIIEINRAWEQMTGISREEAIGHTTFELDLWINPEIRELFIRDLRERGEVKDIEVKVRTKSGEPVYMLMSGQFIDFNREKCLLTMAQDITGSKRMEEKLRMASLYTRNLIEASLDPLVTISSGGKIMDVNKATEHVTGVSRKDLIGSDFSDYFTDPEKAKKGYRQVFSEGIVKDYPLSIRNVSGHVTDVLYNASIYTNEAGEVQGVFAAARDITKRKHAEDALRESEEKYRVLVENMMDGVFLTNMDGEVFAANKAACMMLGMSEKEIIAAGRDGVVDPNDQRLDRALKERAEKGSFRGEISFRKKDGSVFPVEITSAGFKDSLGKARAYVIAHDITGRKKYEEEHLRIQKLESLGLLAGGIAHDFNNILTAILGNISLSRLLVQSDDELSELLGEAEAASIRAQVLTRQLLTFAKGGAPVKETASITEIIRESCGFILHGSKSRCSFLIEEGLLNAEADVGQLNQVINNIVLNASQSMPEGGIIKIAAENTVIVKESGMPLTPGRYVKISVTDQGSGIPEKYLSKIFDPYFTTKQKGSGLGLATAYSIIKRHEGHISVESQLGVGTTFGIYLPASDKPLHEKKVKDVICSGRGKILVMDDEESIRKMVRIMLDQLGYTPELAADGAEAVMIYKKAMESSAPFDAVILDLTIPGGMGGREAVKELLNMDPEAKAIVSSGYSNDDVLSDYKEYGFKAVVPKPYDMLSLGKVLNEVLRKQQ